MEPTHNIEETKIYDLIIIGSGPAGLGAAVYASRAGLKVLVAEKSPVSGGQVLTTYEVDNYLGLQGINGFDLGMKFREHADALGVPFTEEEVTQVKLAGELKEVTTLEHTYYAKTLILATGASHAQLNVPGEAELSGMGVSYCATCDGAFFRGRKVAVVGGGDVALEDAIFLARNCEKVCLLHRRDALRGAASLQRTLENLPNVEICWNTIVEEIQGADQVEKLQLQDVKTGEKKELAVDGVFIAVGIHPNGELFAGQTECDEKGYILAGEDCCTSVPGVFAAGDLRSKQLRQIITAVADGANAVASAEHYLNRC